jgi:uncharacterized membrane protein YcaP (DUF421 family)
MWLRLDEPSGHLRQELVTMDELMSRLREEGTIDLRELKEAYIEPDGTII